MQKKVVAMKRMELQKHKFDSKLRFATFFGLLIFALGLQILHSPLVGEVIAAALVLAGVNKTSH